MQTACSPLYPALRVVEVRTNAFPFCLESGRME
ncbi:hypothetical protein EOD39_20313 [Acipenser ruthenus]|uniref:Uncharacterized protein n=1 Tax=Acipenser ruthenus TaxID=7906 RepID=A0A444UVR8_ACIRT|nr:hypothetical protein EOD39_20313 [Acipenser ruthenus]